MIAHNQHHTWEPGNNWPENENWPANCIDVEYIAIGDVIDIKLDRIVSPFCDGQNGLGSIYVDVEVSCNEAQTYEWVNTADPTVVVSTAQDLINVPPAEYQLTVTYGPCSETFSYDLGITHIVDGDPVWDGGNTGDGIITINVPVNVVDENLIFGSDVHIVAGTECSFADCSFAFTDGREVDLWSSDASTNNISILNANHTTFTSACPTYWDGIQVSARNTNAGAANPYQHRSELNLDNCGIHYAYIGVKNHRETTAIPVNSYSNGTVQTASMGGLVNISDSHFQNNRKDLHIAGTTSSNSWYDYHPRIQDCTSLLNVNHFEDVVERVYIEGSRGFEIIRSSFNNVDPLLLNEQELICVRSTGDENFNQSIQGSSFVVIDDTPNANEISGFTRGIWSTGSLSSLDELYIYGMNFSCYRGIFSEGAKNLRVYRNNFFDVPAGFPYDPLASAQAPEYLELDDEEDTPWETGNQQNDAASYGCYVLGTMLSLDVQENLFDHDNGDVEMRYGFICTNTGGDPDQWVRKNTFYRNDIACSFQGNNRNGVSSEITSQGLIFSCNLFGTDESGSAISSMQNLYDVIIVPVGSSNQGVKLWQNNGLLNQTAGNKWSQNSNVSNDDMFEDIPNVTHNYREDGNEDDPQEVIGVVLQFSQVENPCSSIIQSPELAEISQGEYSVQQLNAEQEYAAAHNEYLLLVDDGDTESLTESVVYSTFSEALELYIELMSASPSLSEDVMLEAIKKEYDLPAGLLTEILSSNPSAAKSERIQEQLDNRGIPLEEWMRQEIDSGLEVVSMKESLEEEMASLLTERWEAIVGQIRAILNDYMVVDKSAAILDILRPDLYLSDRRLTIRLLWETGVKTEALELLQSIPADFQHIESIVVEMEQIEEIWNISNQIEALSESELNPEQLDWHIDVAFAGNSWASSEALESLRSYSNFRFQEPIVAPSTAEPRLLEMAVQESNTTFALYPNPAREWVIFERESFDKPCTLYLIDAVGRQISVLELKTGQPSEIIIIDHLENGAYTFQVRDLAGTIEWSSTLIKIK